MARETALERRAREQREAEAALEEQFEFQKTVPELMFRLKQRAQALNVPVGLNVTEQGFVMTFEFEFGEEVLNTFSTPMWEAGHLVRKLDELEAKQFARVRRRELANAAVAKLSTAELAAMKEFGLAA